MPVHVRYKSLFISLPSSEKLKKTTTATATATATATPLNKRYIEQENGRARAL